MGSVAEIQTQFDTGRTDVDVTAAYAWSGTRLAGGPAPASNQAVTAAHRPLLPEPPE